MTCPLGRKASVIAVLALAGCLEVIPPTPAPARPQATIDASVDATWDAVIEVFASENIPIQTLDRSSGLLVAERVRVSRSDADRWASCGGVKHGLDPVREIHATHAAFNVLVRSRGEGSTARVTVHWISRNPNDPMRPDHVECETTNEWEAGLEARIKRTAESDPVPPGLSMKDQAGAPFIDVYD